MVRYYAVMFFQIALVLIYLGIGVYVLMNPIPVIDASWFGAWGRVIFGVAAIAYGIFRFWRAKRNADDDTEYDEE